MSARKVVSPSALSLRALASVVIFLFGVGCSGGGDGGDSDVSLRTDACDVIGAKIINGAECSTARSAVVGLNISYSDGVRASCSGTLISNQHVLTAAHCFDEFGRDVRSISVSLAGETVSASGFVVHPNFSIRSDDSLPGGAGFFNDAAVVRLAQTTSIAPVPLLLSRPTQAGDIIAIFGFGLDENNSRGRLESGEMLVTEILPNHLVAPFNGEGSNTCQGDSGGPAIVEAGALTGIVGLTSSGDPGSNCREGDISLFANIQAPSISRFILDVAPNAARL